MPFSHLQARPFLIALLALLAAACQGDHPSTTAAQDRPVPRIEMAKPGGASRQDLPDAALQEVPGPFAGYLDEARVVDGDVVARGWAVHKTARRPAEQVLLVDLQSGEKLGLAVMGQDRPDVAAQLGGPQFAGAGWTAAVPLPPSRSGPLRIAAYGLDPASGKGYRLTGEFELSAASSGAAATPAAPARGPANLQDQPGDFAGYLDKAEAAQGVLVAEGWAVNQKLGQPAAFVLLVDGRTGQTVGKAPMTEERPDVAAQFRNDRLVRSGWRVEAKLDKLASGLCPLTAYAQDASGKAYPLKGAAQVRIP